MDKNAYQKKLIERIIKGNDKNAFDEFYDLYYNKLVSFAVKFLGNQDNAEDIVSDLFVNILQKKEVYTKISNVESYLYYCVRNECIRQSKKIRQRIEPDLFLHLPSNDLDPLNELEFNELYSTIEKAINDLPPKRKAIFKLIREEGLKYKEVAERLEISVKTLENQMTQAIAFIRERIQSKVGDNGS